MPAQQDIDMGAMLPTKGFSLSQLSSTIVTGHTKTS